jgi:hypothetical protein
LEAQLLIWVELLLMMIITYILYMVHISIIVEICVVEVSVLNPPYFV